MNEEGALLAVSQVIELLGLSVQDDSEQRVISIPSLEVGSYDLFAGEDLNDLEAIYAGTVSREDSIGFVTVLGGTETGSSTGLRVLARPRSRTLDSRL